MSKKYKIIQKNTNKENLTKIMEFSDYFVMSSKVGWMFFDKKIFKSIEDCSRNSPTKVVLRGKNRPK